MNYSEVGFDIVLINNILTFSGNFEKSDYTKVDAFLRKVDKSLSSDICVVDLLKLSFLNSSGIKSLATFMLESPKTFELRINDDTTWQRESIPPLTCLKPGGIKIVT